MTSLPDFRTFFHARWIFPPRSRFVVDRRSIVNETHERVRSIPTDPAVLRRVVTRVSTTAVEIALRGVRDESQPTNRLQSVPKVAGHR